MFYNNIYIIILFIFIFENVYAKSDFLYGSGIKAGFNFAALGLIAAVIVGTPFFIVINYLLKKYESKKEEEKELKEIQKKIMNKKNLEEHKSNDTYGTAKLLKECIDRSTMAQIFTSNHPQAISPSISTTSSLTLSTPTIQSPQPPHYPLYYHPRTTSCSFSKISSTNSITDLYNRSPNQSPFLSSQQSSPCGSHRTNSLLVATINTPTITTTGSTDETQEIINKIVVPPSPVLSTFGKSTTATTLGADNSTKPNDQLVVTPIQLAFIKRTIAMDQNNQSPPTSARPKNLRISQNSALLNLLSSNTIPKDHWHCIVYRVLELAMSYWSPPKYDGQSSATALNHIELSLTSFSEEEQLNKQLETMDGQKYFSPIIFELYNKILPLHEFIRFRSNKSEKDINSVYGIFTIILHSLFNSFNNWINETDIETRRNTLLQSKENIIIKLGEHINDKSYLHKINMNNLIEYIRNVLFISIKDCPGENLYNIVDHYHGIADDIDRILFENESYVDSEQLKAITKPPNIEIVIEKLKLEENEDEEESEQQDSVLNRSSSSTISQPSPKVGSLTPDEENIVNIISSVTNRFQQIENYLEVTPSTPSISSEITSPTSSSSTTSPTLDPQQDPSVVINVQPSSTNHSTKTMLTLEHQKTVVSSCYNHLQTSIDIFTSAEYSSKLKVDMIPVLRMMLSTLNTLEGYIDNGMSIVDLKPGEILEWTSTFTKIATSINNIILKNSSILSSSQIVNFTNHGGISPSSNNYGNPIRSSGGKIKPPSSPFGSPAIMSFLLANSNDQVYCPTAAVNNNSSSSLSDKPLAPLPPQRERCSQMIQLSQDSIMLAVMSSFALCIKDQMNPVLPQSLKNVSKFFKDNLAVFLSAIRTNIFCTYILLNPIYDMQSTNY